MTPHAHDLAPFVHPHAFVDAGAPGRERALWWVTWITLATMALELAAGTWSGSLALVADGWHMGTHALALGGAALAAHFARRAHGSARFAFGGWKIEVLAAYTSGLLLLAVGVWIAIDALGVLMAPRPVAYAEAIAVAVLGLAVNLACAAILARAGGHGHALPGEDAAHGHGHEAHHDDAHAHGHGHGHARHGDHNFDAAYLHVLADALTSVLAIVALAGGLFWGLRWLDPAVALVGAVVIGRWATGVLRHSATALLDASAPARLKGQVRALIEADGDAQLTDLHVWQVGPGAYSVALSLVADRPLPAAVYRERLARLQGVAHSTVEVNRCGAAPA
ncbi:MAG TPA: CDF family Co(II)/Ni(II) efflux transporter DmeF [Burkholderiaceae bacterium]|nr:CDF family Co(II)/Ni(II) efflux transporter DmeF [Burkholderiaceae bacterium]